MIKIEIKKNDEKQRLDRFLKKYLNKAPLSHIYKMIRKDVKVNGKRAKIETELHEGDEISLYLSDELVAKYREEKKIIKVSKQFKVVYEDDYLIVVNKPFGLLTHGDAVEKKNTLANQVTNYLISTGDYVPSREQTFIPSPVNRLDRNTTGLVLFGKTAESLKKLNLMIKNRDEIEKYYLTIVSGEMKEPIELVGNLVKDEKTNTVKVIKSSETEGKSIETIARPIKTAKGFTLVEVELVTGRTHQIRAHLQSAGFAIIGDIKYGDYRVNKEMQRKYDLSTQFLHAYKLVIEGKEIIGELPDNFKRIKEDIFGK
ncbi:MAG: RluA family pseudouridine synthase [Anaerovoracaceae bacterium]